MKISVVVPVGGAAPAWPRSARSLERLEPPRDGAHEIVVVFDGPVPHGVLSAVPEGAVVLRLERRGGPARARNHGARAARGDVLFFLDSDVEAHPGVLRRVEDLFRPADAHAVIGSYDDDPGHPAFVSQYRNLLHHYVHQTGHEAASTFWSGCGAVRRDAFFAVGGFDEGYAEPSIEDIELGARLRRAGYGIRLAKDFQVKHLKCWTFGGMVHTDLFRRAIPWTEQMLDAGGLVNDLNVKTKDRMGVALAFAALGALLAAPFAFALFRLGRWTRGAAGALGRALLGVAAAAGVGALASGAGFFRFLRRRRGPLFALAAAPLYGVYLLVCGTGFAVGSARHLLRRRASYPGDSAADQSAGTSTRPRTSR